MQLLTMSEQGSRLVSSPRLGQSINRHKVIKFESSLRVRNCIICNKMNETVRKMTLLDMAFQGDKHETTRNKKCSNIFKSVHKNAQMLSRELFSKDKLVICCYLSSRDDMIYHIILLLVVIQVRNCMLYYHNFMR